MGGAGSFRKVYGCGAIHPGKPASNSCAKIHTQCETGGSAGLNLAQRLEKRPKRQLATRLMETLDFTRSIPGPLDQQLQ